MFSRRLGGLLPNSSDPADDLPVGIPAGIPVVTGPAGAPPAGMLAFEVVDADPTGALVRPAGTVVVLRDGSKAWINSDGPSLWNWIDLRNVRALEVAYDTGWRALFSLRQVDRTWYAIADYQDRLFASDYGGAPSPRDIYMSPAGGVGEWTALGVGPFGLNGVTALAWQMAGAGGGLYAAVQFGDIYHCPNPTLPAPVFTPLGEPARNWAGLGQCMNGDVYATETGGDIYRRAGGMGAFVALGEVVRSWNQIAGAPNGDVWAVAGVGLAGAIYRRIGGAGAFVDVGAPSIEYYGITVDRATGEVYASGLGPNGKSLWYSAGGAAPFRCMGFQAYNPRHLAKPYFSTMHLADGAGHIWRLT